MRESREGQVGMPHKRGQVSHPSYNANIIDPSDDLLSSDLLHVWSSSASLGALLISFVISALLASRGIPALTTGALSPSPQHIHEGEIPRLGGVGIALGFVIGLVLWVASDERAMPFVLPLLCGLPALLVGLLEDVSGQLSPLIRYAATICSAVAVVVLADVGIGRVDFFILDYFLQWPAMAALVSVFCIAGVSQSFNIIDGKNGLASGMAIIVLAGMAVLAVQHDDSVFAAAVALASSAILGFWLVNFFSGRLFLGDGGAYLAGFAVAVFSVILVARHDAISPWFPFALALYPITETLFSIVRRIGFEGNRFSDPDHLHMHSLLYRAIVDAVSRLYGMHRVSRRINSITALTLLVTHLLPVAIAVAYASSAFHLKALVASYVLVYTFAYLVLRHHWGAEDSALPVTPTALHDT